jgi:hypothetical protein
MSFWREEFRSEEISYILEKIRSLRVITADGKVSMVELGVVDEWIAILVSALGIDVRTDALKASLVLDALFSPELEKSFTEEKFKAVTYRLRELRNKKNLKGYRVAFELWNAPPFLEGRTRIDDVTIGFSPSVTTSTFKKICEQRSKQRSGGSFDFFFTKKRLQDLQGCSICLAYVKADSPKDAYERASVAIYELLGILNIAKDMGKRSRRSFRLTGKLPVSEVLVAPHSTVHHANGSLAYDGFWYEDWVGGPNKKVDSADGQDGWKARYKQLSRSVARSGWRKHCKIAAVRYYKAFSNPNLEESFLGGWRLFENITGNRDEKIYTKILRASNVFEESIEYRIKGRHLALRRNLISHGHRIKVDDEETLVFQMLQFVQPFLVRFISNGFDFSSREQFWEFLDLPPNKEVRIRERDNLVSSFKCNG